MKKVSAPIKASRGEKDLFDSLHMQVRKRDDDVIPPGYRTREQWSEITGRGFWTLDRTFKQGLKSGRVKRALFRVGGLTRLHYSILGYDAENKK